MADDLLRALGRRQREAPESEDRSEAEDAMLRPFDEGERASLLDAVFERLDAEASEDARDAAPEVEAAPRPSDEIVDLAARRARRGVAIIAVAASLAAALLLWLALRPPSPRDGDPIARSSLPTYAVTRLQGGDASVRSRPDGPPSRVELRPGAEIDWIITPGEPVSGPLGVAIRAQPRGGAAVFVTPLVEISPEGVVRLRGPIEGLGPTAPGVWTLDVLIGRPAELPRSAEAAADEGGWPRVRVEVTIVAAP